MKDTPRQFQVRTNIERLVHHRLTEKELNADLSRIFGRTIEVEQGQYDDDWQGDDYYTFSVDDEEIGGYFDLYYISMPNKPNYFYITEVNAYFE